jgi:hypothetical protein
LVPEAATETERSNVEAETKRYREFLLDELKKAGGRMLAYPTIAHEKVVRRELQRKKPFKQNGSGYRDLLIWESVRSVAHSGHERIAFVTANVKDFAAGERLHTDLAADILNPDRLKLFTSLRDFNARHIFPRLQAVERLHQELDSFGAGSTNVAAWVRAHLLELLCDEELGCVISPDPDAPGRYRPQEIVSFDDLELVSARQLESNELLCGFRVHASVDVNISVDESELMMYRRFVDWSFPLQAGSWNEVYQLVTSLELIIDPATSDVTAHEVTDLQVV